MTDLSSPNHTIPASPESPKTTADQTDDGSQALWPLVRVLADIAQRVVAEQNRQLAEQEREGAA